MCNLSKTFLIYESTTASGCQTASLLHFCFASPSHFLEENWKSHTHRNFHAKETFFVASPLPFWLDFVRFLLFWLKFNLIWFLPLDMASPRQFVKNCIYYNIYLQGYVSAWLIFHNLRHTAFNREKCWLNIFGRTRAISIDLYRIKDIFYNEN